MVSGSANDNGIMIVRADRETVDGDILGGIGFDSEDGNVPNSVTEAGAAIIAYAAEAHSSTAKGTDLVFVTSPIGQADDTASTERMRILDSGKVGIGVADPDSLLEVYGSTVQLKLSNNADDYSTLGVGTNGDLTITTVDAAAGAADFTVVADGAVDIDANAGALSLDGSTGINIGVEADVPVVMESSTLDINAAGNVTLDTEGTLSVDSAGGASNISHTATADGDFTIAMDAGVDASLILSSAGTAADALQISATAGGIDITVAGGASGENLDLVSNTGINLLSTENEPDAITINAAAGGIDILAAGAASEDIDIVNTAGSVNIGAGEADINAITINASNAAGGINIDAGTTGISVDTAGPLSLDSTFNNTGAINITTNAGTSERITVKNTQGAEDAGASVAAVLVQADAGGITLDAGRNIHLSADGGNVVMSDATDTIFDFDVDNTKLTLHDDQDTGDKLEIKIEQHGVTTFTTIDDDAASAHFNVIADGNIVLDAQGVIDIDADAGRLNLDGSAGVYIGTETDTPIDIDSTTLDIDASGAITMDSTSTIVISGDGGATLSDDTEGLSYDGSGNVDFDAVTLDIDASGAIDILGGSTLSIDAVDDSNITVTASGKDLDIAVAGGSTQELRLTSAGAGASALKLNATAGTIDIDAVGAVAIDSAAIIQIGATTAAPVDMNSTSLDIDASGAVTVDSTSTIVISGDAGASIGDDTEALAYDGSGNVDFDAVALDIDASGAITIDGTSTLSLDAADSVNLTMAANHGSTKNLTIDASNAGAGVARVIVGATSGTAISIGHATSETTVNDNLTVQGDLTVNGTTTTVNSTTISVDDPVIVIGGELASGSDDNKDRGIEFHWHNGSAGKTGFMGYDDSGGVFTFIPDATNASEVFSGNPGTVRVRRVDLYDDGAEHIYGDGDDINFGLASGGDINIPANIGLTFGADGEKIEGNGTNLTIQGGDINLTAEADINIPSQIGLTFGADTNKIEVDGSNNLEIDAAGKITLDSGGDIILDAAGSDIDFLRNGVLNARLNLNKTWNGDHSGVDFETMGYLKLRPDSGEVIFASGSLSEYGKIQGVAGDMYLSASVSDKDMIFMVNDGGTPTEVFRLDGDVSALKIAASKQLQLGAAEEHIYGDGTDIHFGVGAGGDINIPANIGLTFGNDGENISGDGTNLTIQGGDINLTAEANVNIPSGIGVTFGNDGEKISGDGTDLTISGNNINLTATEDVVIPANVGILMGGGEKIESDGTDLTITVGAGGDINVPANIGLTFGNDGEKIEGDGTKLIVSASELDFVIEVGGDINIPSEIGLTFGNDGEKIEGDGFGLTAKGGFVILDSESDIWLNSDSGNWVFQDGSYELGSIRSRAGNLYLSSSQQNKDMIFMVNDAGAMTEIFRLDGSTSALAISGSKQIQLGTAEEHIYGDGTDIHFGVGAGGDINIPANIGLTFGNDGEKIEGDGTNLTIAGADINLTAAANINIPTSIGLTFGNDGEKIEGDGVGLTAKGGFVILDSESDIWLDSDLGNWVLKDSGTEIGSIRSRSSDLYLSSSVSDKDMIFMVNDGGTMTEVMRLDGDVSALKVAPGKQVRFGSANVSLSNSTVSGKQNDLILASHLLNVESEETYYSGDVFVSGTLTPNALALTNLDLQTNSYIRFGDANNYIQRVSNDLTFRDTATGGVKTLTDLSSIGAISTAFEMLATQSPDTLKIRSTGSFSLSSANQYAEQVASDIYFYVSGTIDRGSSSDTKVAAFGGDVVASGSLVAGARFNSWGAAPGTVQYALSASFEAVGYQAPLIGKNNSGVDVFSILPGYDITKAANSSLVSILGEVSDGNIIFGVNDGGTPTEVMRLQGNNASLRMAATKNLEFGGTSRYISSPNTTVINYVNSNADAAHQFTGHILPATNNTYDLGSESSRFRNIYTGDLNLKNDKGDWTIVEEADYLCVINNTTGKKFKMMLEPIEESE
jgi:hypothetical protein